MKQKKGGSGILGWSLRPLSSSTSCHSYTLACASGIHSLNRLQSESYLHLPIDSLTVLIFATHSVWTRSPWSTHPHPRGTAVVMVTPIMWHREGRPVKAGRGEILRHRWLLQSLVQARLGPSLFCWQQTSTLIHALPAEVLVARAGLRLHLVFVLCQHDRVLIFSAALILRYFQRATVVWKTSVFCCELNSFLLMLTFLTRRGGGLQLEVSRTLTEAHLHTRDSHTDIFFTSQLVIWLILIDFFFLLSSPVMV